MDGVRPDNSLAAGSEQSRAVLTCHGPCYRDGRAAAAAAAAHRARYTHSVHAVHARRALIHSRNQESET